jgi:hypothetical protein
LTRPMQNCMIWQTWLFYFKKWSWEPVAHPYNPSYSGGRDWEDHNSKPALANGSWNPILKKPFTKKSWWSGSRCRPWVKASVPQKKKKKEVIAFLLYKNLQMYLQETTNIQYMSKQFRNWSFYLVITSSITHGGVILSGWMPT